MLGFNDCMCHLALSKQAMVSKVFPAPANVSFGFLFYNSASNAYVEAAMQLLRDGERSGRGNCTSCTFVSEFCLYYSIHTCIHTRRYVHRAVSWPHSLHASFLPNTTIIPLAETLSTSVLQSQLGYACRQFLWRQIDCISR